MINSKKLVSMLETLSPKLLLCKDHPCKELFDKESKILYCGFKKDDNKIIFDLFISTQLVEIKIIIEGFEDSFKVFKTPHSEEEIYNFIKKVINKYL